MNKKTFFVSIALLIAAWGFSQTSDFNHQIGISLKGSTNGVGGDIYYRPTKMLAIKAGVEFVDANITAETMKPYVGDALIVSIPMPTDPPTNMIFDAGAKFKTGALSAAIGFQPFGGLYLTAGVGKFLFASEVIGAPRTDLAFESQNVPGVGKVDPKIFKDVLGNFSITVNPANTITPYVGIGLGSFVPRKGAVSFALELGAYYLGSYVLHANLPPGLKSENVDYGSNVSQAQKDQYFGSINNDIDAIIVDLDTEVNKAIDEVNKTIEPYGFYPVIKLTIGIRALTFKK